MPDRGHAFDLAKIPALPFQDHSVALCRGRRKESFLHINTDKARSPEEIGINNDPRRFGIWVERVTVHQSER